VRRLEILYDFYLFHELQTLFFYKAVQATDLISLCFPDSVEEVHLKDHNQSQLFHLYIDLQFFSIVQLLFAVLVHLQIKTDNSSYHQYYHPFVRQGLHVNQVLHKDFLLAIDYIIKSLKPFFSHISG
jgi:hypothetical protein